MEPKKKFVKNKLTNFVYKIFEKLLPNQLQEKYNLKNFYIYFN